MSEQNKEITKKDSGLKGQKVYRLGIFSKVLVNMLLVALLPLSLLWLFYFNISQNELRQSIEQNFQNTSEILINQIDGWVELNLRILDKNAESEEIRSMDAEKQHGVLSAMHSFYDWTYFTFTTSPNGQMLARNDDYALGDFSDYAFFKEMTEGKGLGEQITLGRTSSKPALFLARPIFEGSRSNSELIGIIGLSSHLQTIEAVIENTLIGETGFAFLTDGEGTQIAHGQSVAFNKVTNDLARHPSLAADFSKLNTYVDNGRKVVVYSQKTSLGWTLVIQQDYKEAFSPILKFQTIALNLLLITLLCVLIVSYLLTRSLVKPVQDLTTAADRISRGLSQENIRGTHRQDEIGSLARSLERLRNSIQIALSRLK